MSAFNSTGDLLAEPYVECIKGSGLLNGVPEDRIQDVIKCLHPRPCEFADREEVCREGDKASSFWIVVKGRVDVQHNANNLVDRAPPYVIGEQAIIEDGETRSATLTAYGPTELLEIHRNGVEKLPADLGVFIWRSLATILSTKLRGATAWRSAAIDRDRNNTAMLRRFLNPHQQGLIRAQGPITPDNLPSKLERGRFVLIFTDVVGFSRLALNLADDKTADMIRACMQVQANAFETSGGFVDKFMGDGLMAYFPIPDGAGDNDVSAICVSALDAAFDANERVKALPMEGDPLGLRIGLHLGEALAGNFGSNDRMQVTLIGREVNTAARLEQAKVDTLRDSEGKELGDVRVSLEFLAALPEDRRVLLPYEAVVKAKQADIPLRSGPPRPVVA